MFFAEKMRKGQSKQIIIKGLGVTRPFVNKRNRLMLGTRKRTIKSLGVTRPFVNKRNRLMLDTGKRKIIRKQKGGFWGPLLATLVPTAADLVKKIIK